MTQQLTILFRPATQPALKISYGETVEIFPGVALTAAADGQSLLMEVLQRADTKTLSINGKEILDVAHVTPGDHGRFGDTAWTALAPLQVHVWEQNAASNAAPIANVRSPFAAHLFIGFALTALLPPMLTTLIAQRLDTAQATPAAVEEVAVIDVTAATKVAVTSVTLTNTSTETAVTSETATAATTVAATTTEAKPVSKPAVKVDPKLKNQYDEIILEANFDPITARGKLTALLKEIPKNTTLYAEAERKLRNLRGR